MPKRSSARSRRPSPTWGSTSLLTCRTAATRARWPTREKNSRLRIEGTRNLMAAASAANVRRVIAQSIAFVYAPGKKPYRETDPLDASEAQRMTISGVVALEDAVLKTPGIDGIVLRY